MAEWTSSSRSRTVLSYVPSLWSFGHTIRAGLPGRADVAQPPVDGQEAVEELVEILLPRPPGARRSSAAAAAVPSGVGIVIGPLTMARPCSASVAVASSGAPRAMPRMTSEMRACWSGSGIGRGHGTSWGSANHGYGHL